MGWNLLHIWLISRLIISNGCICYLCCYLWWFTVYSECKSPIGCDRLSIQSSVCLCTNASLERVSIRNTRSINRFANPMSRVTYTVHEQWDWIWAESRGVQTYRLIRAPPRHRWMHLVQLSVDSLCHWSRYSPFHTSDCCWEGSPAWIVNILNPLLDPWNHGYPQIEWSADGFFCPSVEPPPLNNHQNYKFKL